MLTVTLIGGFTINGQHHYGQCVWQVRSLPPSDTWIDLPHCPEGWEPTDFYAGPDEHWLSLKPDGEFDLRFEMIIDEECKDPLGDLRAAGWAI